MKNVLVPEPRVNKNGVTSIKHVRADPKKKSARSAVIPAPSGTPKLTTDVITPTPAVLRPFQTREEYQDLWHLEFEPSRRLLDFLADESGIEEDELRYQFTATDEEIYSVLSVINPDDAVALLDAGVRSGEQAAAKVREAGLDKLVDDFTDLTDEALRRGIPSNGYLRSFSRNLELFRDDPDSFLDEAQKFSEGGLDARLKKGSPTTLRSLIDADEINIEHLREISVRTFMEVRDDDGLLIDELKKMHAGTSLYTMSDLECFIDKFDITYKKSSDHDKRIVYTLAGRHGAAFVDGMRAEMISMHMTYELAQTAHRRLGYWEEKERAFIEFGNTLSKEVVMNRGDEDYAMLFESGVDAAAAGKALARGLEPMEIIAIEKHGITPSLADGSL